MSLPYPEIQVFDIVVRGSGYPECCTLLRFGWPVDPVRFDRTDDEVADQNS